MDKFLYESDHVFFYYLTLRFYVLILLQNLLQILHIINNTINLISRLIIIYCFILKFFALVLEKIVTI